MISKGFGKLAAIRNLSKAGKEDQACLEDLPPRIELQDIHKTASDQL
jgi:hypothetical protein